MPTFSLDSERKQSYCINWVIKNVSQCPALVQFRSYTLQSCFVSLMTTLMRTPISIFLSAAWNIIL